MINENMKITDIVEIYKIENGELTEKVLETNNSPSLYQQILTKLGLYKCAHDIIMDAGLVEVASHLVDTYDYVGIGIVNTDPLNTTLTELKSQLMRSQVESKTLTTTYVTNDTARFLSTFTAPGSYTLVESGLFKESTPSATDGMFCRQTFTTYRIDTGDTFGVIWKIIVSRG